MYNVSVKKTNFLHTSPETMHKSGRANWLRAAVLGINDGVVSTSSLMLGVSAAASTHTTILTAGIAGLAAGALSMAIGEYVSVSSQRDSELADIELEEKSLAKNPEEELAELAAIYESRGLQPELARKVAEQLHAHDAVSAHMRDELGIDEKRIARPLQAAAASALAFTLGAAVPIVGALISSSAWSALVIVGMSLGVLAISGAVGAFLGGGNRVWAAGRVFLGGGIAMAITALIGYVLGQSF